MVRRTGPITLTKDLARWLNAKTARPWVGGGQSVSNEETSTMEMIAPTTSLADILGRVATVAEKWLEHRFSQEEGNKPTAEPKYLTPEEVATILRLNVQTVLKWCRNGKISATKLGGNEVNGKGGKYLITRESVDAYIAQRTLIHGEKRRATK